MRKIAIGIAVVSAIVLVLYLMGYILPYVFVSREAVVNNSNCRDEQMANNEIIQGTVKLKFRDKDNHMWKTVEYTDDIGSFTTLIFRNDESGAYDFLIQDDSIVKKRGSLDLQVFRNGQEQAYKLEYGCK